MLAVHSKRLSPTGDALHRAESERGEGRGREMGEGWSGERGGDWGEVGKFEEGGERMK